jgi:hypothetical protein
MKGQDISRGSGNLVTYIDKDGNTSHAIVYFNEQLVEALEKNKFLLVKTDIDFEILLDKNGKEVKVLKNQNSLKVVGYID